jgi:hypothetical protein
MKKFVSLLLVLVCAAPASAWNDRGHMVVARLAWRKLTEQQRGQVVNILRNHPHYAEFLAANRPEGFSEDEWVFMRAATWADWVRSHHQSEYNHGPWHYVDIPFIPSQSNFKMEGPLPDANQPNIVTTLTACVEKIRNGSPEEKAVYVCWLFHLVGDIHQPLHTTSMFSEKFPEGDRGGNLVTIRIRTNPINLHSFWDGLLGSAISAAEIGRDVNQIEQVTAANGDAIKNELATNQTFESWAKEGHVLCKSAVYLDGKLEFAVADPNAPATPPSRDLDEYASAAGKLARVQIGKAGQRLADVVCRSLEPASTDLQP